MGSSRTGNATRSDEADLTTTANLSKTRPDLVHMLHAQWAAVAPGTLRVAMKQTWRRPRACLKPDLVHVLHAQWAAIAPGTLRAAMKQTCDDREPV